jgi:hypothetical protein
MRPHTMVSVFGWNIGAIMVEEWTHPTSGPIQSTDRTRRRSRILIGQARRPWSEEMIARTTADIANIR